MKSRICRAALAILCSAGVIGCETKAQSGALIGGLGGAAIGGAIGSHSHARAGEGALIGAAVGAIGGALVGHGMDKADEKAAREYDRHPDAYSSQDPHYGYQTSSGTVTKADVREWSRAGVKDEIIIDRVERSGTVFKLNAKDVNELRDAGVSEAVIVSMKATARR